MKCIVSPENGPFLPPDAAVKMKEDQKQDLRQQRHQEDLGGKITRKWREIAVATSEADSRRKLCVASWTIFFWRGWRWGGNVCIFLFREFSLSLRRGRKSLKNSGNEKINAGTLSNGSNWTDPIIPIECSHVW